MPTTKVPGNILWCCLFIIAFSPFASRAQDSLPAINAVYITDALYNNIPVTDLDKKKHNLFLDYVGYYLKNSPLTEIDRYPFLKNLYGAYGFAISDTEAFNMIDPQKLKDASGADFKDIKRVYDSAVAERAKYSTALKDLKEVSGSLEKLGIVSGVDEDDSTAIFSRLNVLRQIPKEQISDTEKREIDSLTRLSGPVLDYLFLQESLQKLQHTVKEKDAAVKRELKALAVKMGQQIKTILGKCDEVTCRNLVNLKQLGSNNKYLRAGNEFTLTNQYSIAQNAAGQGFSMPNQTQMIDAMAIFLAKRVQQESVLWFFDELKKKAKLIKELNIVFPACMALLKNSEEYDMPKMGKAWRYAIAQDFSTMPVHFFEIPFMDSFLSREKIDIKQLREYVSYGDKIAALTQKRYSIDETINNLYMNLKGNLADSIVSPDHFITLLYAVKQEFYVVNKSGKYLLSPATLMDMPDSMFMTMLSLADLRYNQVFSKLLVGKYDNFTFQPEEINKIRKVIARILQEMQQIDNVAKQVKHNSEDKDNIDFSSLSYTTWQFTSDLILVFDDLIALTTNSKTIKSKQVYHIQTDLGTLRAILDVYAHIDKKDYYGAVRKMFNITYALMKRYPVGTKPPEYMKLRKLIAEYNMTSPRDTLKRNRSLELIHDQILVTQKIGFDNLEGNPMVESPYPLLAMRAKPSKKDSAVTEQEMKNMRKALDFEKSRYFVLKIASFLNDVSSATNSKDLSNVISAYALPPTSYKRKTSTWNNVFINAFVGPYVGKETLASGASKGVNPADRTGYVYGITAPIGIAISKTFSKPGVKSMPDDVDCKFIENGKRNRGKFRNMSRSTLSVFLSIVDIGAVVSYRFSNTDSALPQQFKWQQFISPGLHLQYSIHGTPFVVSTGAVYTPQIRKIGEGNQQYSAIRGYLGLLFDIPMITVHSKEKYKGIEYKSMPVAGP